MRRHAPGRVEMLAEGRGCARPVMGRLRLPSVAFSCLRLAWVAFGCLGLSSHTTATHKPRADANSIAARSEHTSTIAAVSAVRLDTPRSLASSTDAQRCAAGGLASATSMLLPSSERPASAPPACSTLNPSSSACVTASCSDGASGRRSRASSRRWTLPASDWPASMAKVCWAGGGEGARAARRRR